MSAQPIGTSLDDLPADATVMDYALAYAALGWAVFPTGGGPDGKAPHPTVSRWSVESTSDPEGVVAMFAGISSPVGIGVDLAKSGLAVLDGDQPDLLLATFPTLPDAKAWTLQGNPERCSYLFASDGTLGCPKAPWGDVKGAGGYIVLPPSPHPIGGAYVWLDRPGDAPPTMPEEIRSTFPNVGGKADAATTTQVRGFLDTRTASLPDARATGLLGNVVTAFQKAVTRGDGRHASAAEVLAWAMEDAAAGLYPARLAADTLESEWRRSLDLAPARQPEPGEWARLLAWGVGKGLALTPDEIAKRRAKVDADRQEPGWQEFGRTTGPDSSQEFDWGRRPWLAWCDEVGRTRGLPRWGLVGAVLAMASAEVSPEVRVASPVGTNDTSLNLYVLLYGRSGAGKSQSDSTVARAHRWTYDRHRLGSGEGLAAGYTRRVKSQDPNAPKGSTVPERHAWRLYAWVDEYQQVVGVKARGGATLGPELRTAWSGGALGMDYRDPDKRLPVAADTYRLSMLAGIQQSVVRDVFAGAGVGDLQRYLWMDTEDEEGRASWPDEPPEGEVPALPIHLPEAVTANAVAYGQHTHPGRLVMATAPAVRSAVWRGHLRQEQDGEHDNQQRLRVSGLLALLDGRLLVTEEDWGLAGSILARSAWVRARAASGLAEEAVEQAKGRGRLAAVAEEAKAQQDTRRVARRLAQQVAKHGGPVGKRRLRETVSSRDKDFWEDALALTLDLGWLVEIQGSVDAAGKAGKAYEVGPSWSA